MFFSIVAVFVLAALQLAGTGAARAIDIQTVMVGVERIEASRIHEGCEVGVLHLFDLSTRGADQVGVGQGDALILGLHALKHMTPQHLGLDEQFDGIIYR